MTQLSLASNKELIDIQTEAGIGFWIWDTDSDYLYWDAGMYYIFEVDKTLFFNTYAEYAKAVLPDDLSRIESNLGAVMGDKSEFVNVFRIKTVSGIKYIKAYGSWVSDTTLAGVNIELSKAEYYKALGAQHKDIEVVRHYAARKALFGLKQKFVKPVRFEPSVWTAEWTDIDPEILPNTRYRILNQDKTSHLVTEWISMNGAMDSHYHLEDELVTNLADSPLDVWVSGEYNQLNNKDTIFIPKGEFHKFKCDGVCHFMVTWFNYFLKGVDEAEVTTLNYDTP